MLILVSLAILIAAPLAWLATSNWLENFAYNIEPGIGSMNTFRHAFALERGLLG